MKILFLVLLAALSSHLQAAIGRDQFVQVSLPINHTYGKALEICKEKGFSHFLIKKILYSDERGQTLEFRGISSAEGSTLIAETVTQELDPPLGTIQFDFELLCFKEAPKDLLAVDVQGVLDFVALMQNQQPVKAMAGSHVREINTLDELNAELAKAKGPVYLDCYSSSCPPCKVLAPKFDAYSQDLSSKGVFLKINLDSVSEMGAQYKIRSLPTLLVFQEQKEVERKISLPEIIKYFENLK
jgi:thiol-disulfide isomerase/thioredoxin